MATKLAMIASQCREDGLAGTTIVAYCYKWLGMPLSPYPEYREAKRVIDNIEYAFRHDVIHRAPVMEVDELQAILPHIRCPFSRFTIELMTTT